MQLGFYGQLPPNESHLLRFRFPLAPIFRNNLVEDLIRSALGEAREEKVRRTGPAGDWEHGIRARSGSRESEWNRAKEGSRVCASGADRNTGKAVN